MYEDINKINQYESGNSIKTVSNIECYFKLSQCKLKFHRDRVLKIYLKYFINQKLLILLKIKTKNVLYIVI